MCDPKEVIQGLTQCTQPNEGVWCICTNPVTCPYLNTECCEWHLMDDALTLIQQQQARIAELEAELGQRDYNAAVEMQQYCERYEPTYNPEDGGM